MLDQLGKHGGFDLRIAATGDLHIDTHHTVEDVAISLGEAFRAGARRQGRRAPVRQRSVPARRGAGRGRRSTCPAGRSSCGRSSCPSACRSATRRSTRSSPSTRSPSFATAAGITLHVTLRRGRNVHHIIEAAFKGLARCLRDAVRVEGAQVPSTKGVL